MDTDRLLARAYLDGHPGEAARVLERLAAAEAVPLLEEVPPGAAAAVLRHMAPTSGAECLARLAREPAGRVLAALPLDAAAALLRRLGPEERSGALAAAPEQVSGPLGLLLRHPEGTAGALMDPQVLAVPEDLRVGEARARVRRGPRHVLYYLYVVDRDQTLVGVLNLRELLLARARDRIGTVMRTRVARLSARADRSAIVAHPGWRSVHALPVVDEAGRFLGAMRYETLRGLEADGPAGERGARRALALALALGELYWVGMSGMVEGVRAALPAREGPGPPEETDHGT